MIFRRQQKCVKPVCDLHEGEKGTIVQIRGKIAEHRHLCALGIAVGHPLAIERVIITPHERIITVKAGDIELILDKYFIRNIYVKVPVAVEERKLSNPKKECA